MGGYCNGIGRKSIVLQPKSEGDIIMGTQESSENYLETIFMLKNQGNNVRSIDIVNELEYTRPSVSIAMKKLRESGYIEVDAEGFISLTEAGQSIAESMYERHLLISDWLIFLGVDQRTALHDACRMEHVMSEQSFKAIKRHVEEWQRDR